jgi:hypothetical protein
MDKELSPRVEVLLTRLDIRVRKLESGSIQKNLRHFKMCILLTEKSWKAI